MVSRGSNLQHPSSYRWHHGDLLPKLVDAADELVKTEGVDAVTLRAVASRVPKGSKPVSHTAAMTHVHSVLELLAHVAARWWERLPEALAQAVDGDAPAARLVQIGVSYRKFAVEHPRHFRLMYDARLWQAIAAMDSTSGGGTLAPPKGFKSLDALQRMLDARNAAFLLFVDGVLAGRAEGAFRTNQPAGAQARLVASLSHGLAMEALDEGLEGDEVATLLTMAVEALSVGPA